MNPAKIIRGHLDRLGRSYKKLLQNFEEEKVHQFRVRVKRARAFIRLVRHAVAKPRQLKLPRKLLDLYHFTGSVRNLQLQRQRILHLSFKAEEIWPGAYLKLLATEEEQWKQKAASLGGGKGISKKGKKLEAVLPRKLKKKQVKAFVQEKAGAIRKILFLEQLQDADLHQLRKILKDILYSWSYISSYIVAALPASWSGQKKIEDFTVALGDFQDLCIALDLLAPSFIDKKIGAGEATTIENIKRQLEIEKYWLGQILRMKIATIKKQDIGAASQHPVLK